MKNIEPQSPTYREIQINYLLADNKVTLTFDHVAGGLRTVDVNDVRGFAICGEDHKWVLADAKITGGDTIEVWSDAISAPVAVRYAWASNPVCNVCSKVGLPLTPFRTDDFPMTTKPAEAR